MKILLIAGGWSPEREISLEGAKTVASGLRSLGHAVTLLDLALDFDSLLKVACRHDFAFINLHGAPGEDGLVQALLDTISCPYQGSGPAGSFLALNKAAAKQVFKFHGLPTPDWRLVTRMPDPGWQIPFPWPVFVKSATGGSSLRMGKACDREELSRLLDEILAVGDCAILEPALAGKDVSCGVLDDEALPPVLIEPIAGSYFDYKSKYQENGAREICPAPLPETILRKVQQLALSAHRALGLRGISRADFLVDEHGAVNILEVNTLPGMTGTSLIRREAASIGITLEALLEKLIQTGLRQKRDHQP